MAHLLARQHKTPGPCRCAYRFETNRVLWVAPPEDDGACDSAGAHDAR
jgi:hypothetical protein